MMNDKAIDLNLPTKTKKVYSLNITLAISPELRVANGNSRSGCAGEELCPHCVFILLHICRQSLGQ